jgi:hypothetical protein
MGEAGCVSPLRNYSLSSNWDPVVSNVTLDHPYKVAIRGFSPLARRRPPEEARISLSGLFQKPVMENFAGLRISSE